MKPFKIEVKFKEEYKDKVPKCPSCGAMMYSIIDVVGSTSANINNVKWICSERKTSACP